LDERKELEERPLREIVVKGSSIPCLRMREIKYCFKNVFSAIFLDIVNKIISREIILTGILLDVLTLHYCNERVFNPLGSLFPLNQKTDFSFLDNNKSQTEI